MTYEEFKISLATAVTNLAGEEVDVTVHKVQKNNGIILDAITVMRKGECIAPSIYLEELYYWYENGVSMSELAEKIISLSMENRLKTNLPEDFFMEYQKISSRVCYRLVNYEKNQVFLKTVPHKRVLDLAVVYYYLVDPDLMENASVMIRNTDIERWNVTQMELDADASKNTPRILGWDFLTIMEVVENLIKNHVSDVGLDIGEDEIAPMYVLTNKERFLGAACILYPHVLEQIAELLDNHFYILPSSIHECIIMPVSGFFSQESLSRMVAEINASHLDDMEVLSDHAYLYDRIAKKIIF